MPGTEQLVCFSGKGSARVSLGKRGARAAGPGLHHLPTTAIPAMRPGRPGSAHPPGLPRGDAGARGQIRDTARRHSRSSSSHRAPTASRRGGGGGARAARPRAGAAPTPARPLSAVPAHLARKPWPEPPGAPARCTEARESSVGSVPASHPSLTGGR